MLPRRVRSRLRLRARATRFIRHYGELRHCNAFYYLLHIPERQFIPLATSFKQTDRHGNCILARQKILFGSVRISRQRAADVKLR